MLNKEELLNFLLKARTKTYAGGGGKVKAVFRGSKQLEYKEGSWFYRDVYYTGNGIFVGIETIYYGTKPVFAMSYWGNFKGMTEKEIDKILRKALLENWKNTRIWKRIEWKYNNYKYICEPDFKGSIEEMAGKERIFKKGKQVYSFFYRGGLLISLKKQNKKAKN